MSLACIVLRPAIKKRTPGSKPVLTTDGRIKGNFPSAVLLTAAVGVLLFACRFSLHCSSFIGIPVFRLRNIATFIFFLEWPRSTVHPPLYHITVVL